MVFLRIKLHFQQKYTVFLVLAIKNWESNFFRQSIQKNNRLAGSILNDLTGQKSKVNDNTNGFGASGGFLISNGFGQSSIFSNPFGNQFTSGQSSSSPSEWVQQLYRMNNKRDFIRWNKLQINSIKPISCHQGAIESKRLFIQYKLYCIIHMNHETFWFLRLQARE